VREQNMPITMHLDIVSAENEIHSGSVQYVVVSAMLGEVGIKPGHAPMLAVLKPGEIVVTRADGSEDIYYVSGGLLEVQPYHTTILADTVQRADSLDEAAALEAQKKAEEAMQNKKSEVDYTLAAAELARAVAQIRAIQKLRKNHHS
jgi:F-type H+-transporting ATPase subunit epsilon